jgi:hypothetical protein
MRSCSIRASWDVCPLGNIAAILKVGLERLSGVEGLQATVLLRWSLELVTDHVQAHRHKGMKILN